MIKKDLYVLVDHNINNVINHPTELPENWNNIHGLHSLSDIELSDLEWAGHSNLGWVKFNSEFPSTYAFSDNWESFARLSIKEIYSNQRWKAELKGILYNNILIKTDERTKITLLLKKDLMSRTSTETFSWKNEGEIIKFDIQDVINISNSIDDYVQKCFDIEALLIQELNLTQNPLDFTKFNLDIQWPSNIY